MSLSDGYLLRSDGSHIHVSCIVSDMGVDDEVRYGWVMSLVQRPAMIMVDIYAIGEMIVSEPFIFCYISTRATSSSNNRFISLSLKKHETELQCTTVATHWGGGGMETISLCSSSVQAQRAWFSRTTQNMCLLHTDLDLHDDLITVCLLPSIGLPESYVNRPTNYKASSARMPYPHTSLSFLADHFIWRDVLRVLLT